MDVLLRLGPYRFSVDTAAYQQLRRRATFEWPALPRLWNEPAIQYAGAGPEEISIDGTILPAFHGGLDQIAQMRELARAPLGQLEPEPYALVTGYGEYLGEWAILEVEESWDAIQSRGAPGRQRFSLRLRRYTRDSA